MLLLFLRPKRLIVLAVVVLVALPFLPQAWMRLDTWGDRYSSASTTPSRDVAMVFGAGLKRDGTPSPFLQQRLDLAVDLWDDHKVKAVLVTGDNGHTNHDEPTAMKTYLIAKGIPTLDVVVDDAGFSTYDSCYRAKAVFGVHSAVVVTQGYHLPRAVYTCQHLGINAVGLGGSELSRFPKDTLSYSAREVLSSAKAGWQLIRKPKPHFLGPHETGIDAALASRS